MRLAGFLPRLPSHRLADSNMSTTRDAYGTDAPGLIVLLNGSSSAGKTTLAHALQDVMEDAWQHVALDQFRDGMPGRYRGINAPDGSSGEQGLNVVPVHRRGELVTEIRFGGMGHRMLRGMHRAVAAFASAGNNVVLDDILFEPKMLDDYLDALRDHWVLFVGVRCPLSVVTARENVRMGRFPGTAFSHFDEVHVHGCYDLEVDTDALPPRECALQIHARIRSGVPPQAFARLRRDRGLA